MLDDLTELPEGWEETTIGEIILPYETAQPQKNPESKYRYIDIGSIDNTQQTIIETKTFLGKDAPSRARRIVKEGDILFSTVRTYLKNIARVNSDFDGILTSTGIAILRASEIVEPDYLFHYVISEDFLQKIARTMDGTLYPAINDSDLSNALIPLPPLNEQKRIVAKIEELRSHTQAARSAIDHIPKLLEQFRQSVLAAAFRGDLTAEWRSENPDVEHSWKKMTIGEVIHDLKYGTSQKCEYESSLIPVLRIPNIGDGLIKHSDMKYAALPEKELESLKLIPGDILLIRSNGSVSLVGKSAIITEKERGFAYAGYLIRLRPNLSLIDSEYFNFCLSSHDIRLQIEIPAKSTSGVHNINTQEVKRLEINLPEILEQKEIIFKVKSLLTSIDRIEQQYQFTKTELDRLDRSILAKAFKGELVPQDPTDEAAIVLLERIREMRSSQIKPVKTKRKKA